MLLRSQNIRLVAVCVGWFVLLGPSSTTAQAQTVAPSQVTPPTLRPAPAERPPDIAVPGPAAVKAPEGADSLFFVVGRVEVEGEFAELHSATDALTHYLAGRRISVAELYAAAAELERAYSAAGYPLVRVSLPPQHLQDEGAVRVVVVDGFIESVDTSALPARARATVFARVQRLIGRHHLLQQEIERTLLTAGSLPGLNLRSSLARGEQLGGTRLVLDGTDDWMSTTLGGDNRMSSTLGGKNVSANVALNGALGVGEQLYLSAQRTPDFGGGLGGAAPLRTVGGGLVLPVGTDGLTLNPEYTNTRTRPESVIGVPDTVSEFTRMAVRVEYPWIRSRSQTLNLTGELDYIEERTDYVNFDAELRSDRLAVLRIGGDWSAPPTNRRATTLGVTLSQGLGGRTAADARAEQVPLSRVGAEPVFSKLNADLHVTWVCSAHLQSLLVAHAQTTFHKPVLQSEQFALDGADAVSAFVPGSFTVDEGATLRAELQGNMAGSAAPTAGWISPYLFVAGGRGFIDQPTALEQAALTAAAAGIGLRGSIRLSQHGVEGTFGLEGARQRTDAAFVHDGYRFNATFGLRF